MKVNSNSVFDLLSGLRAYFQGDSALVKFNKEEPFLSELFSSTQLDEHAKAVAKSHKVIVHQSSDQLLKRLEDNEVSLLEVRNILVESIREGKDITPGAEWLLDNFYLIEEQVVLARKHLPKGYSEGLPGLANGVSTGMPRIYDIVLEIISHSDGRVDIKSLTSFIASYQTNTVLTLGELWAIPIMLRLAVLENLRRVGTIISLDMIDNNLANHWAERMLTTVKDEPGDLILTIADMARLKPILTSSFVATFIRELQGKGPALALPLSWMEQQLSGIGLSSNDLVRLESQKQAADQVSVRNSIGTLRFIGATDWRDFVESLSSVEKVLRNDITGIYPHMDFSTRDRYRHVVESISKFSPLSETEVAQRVLELTEKHNATDPITKRKEHIGYYLIDKGLEQAEQAAGMRYSVRQKLIRSARKIPVFLYLFSITFLTFTVAAAMWRLAYVYGAHSWLTLTVVALLSISGSAQLAVSLVNWLCTLWVKPNFLPRMDFSTGIPAECRTLVAIPTMLTSSAYIGELIDALEIRFLANRESNLHLALLTDFIDADAESMPEDKSLLELASHHINALNEKYNPTGHDTFFLFHRPRKWNSQEGKWMGYERKRGKLSALNAFIRGRSKDEFSLIVGNHALLNQVKYVITLDSDTQLPRETAWKFIATMAHPLNQAVYSSKRKRVIDGYGILQPRVAASIPKTAVSLYLRMQGSVSGIDPYTKVSSDVYQDLFAEGSFIGKGIYDVDIFEKTIDGIFPENRILSHDLLEGCYTRSGMMSDVILYEDNPSEYLADVKRHHRWIRGDWQIGAWMLPFVSGGNGRLTLNPLSALSRWKILDNLRRSVLPLSLILILILGWSVLPFPWFWTLTVTVIVLLPVMAATGWQLLNKPQEITVKVHFLEVFTSLRDVLIRFVFGMAVLPHEAFKYTDAVLRTNWRMIVTGKKLLQWTPSGSASRNSGNDIWSAYTSMWMAPLLALIFIVTLLYINPGGLLVAWPILILWLTAPVISWRLNSPLKDDSPEFVEEELLFLHKTARKTWGFFEKFVSAEENWMPPDNFQEQPAAIIAHRTSPTNMGLALLANLSAYDFGYIGSAELIDRTNNTLQSMLMLERYKGHFYNWYNTLSLLPLQPRYVSTVDSGNLIGHLLTLRQGLLALNSQPIVSESIYQGIATTLSIIEDFSKSDDGEVINKIKSLLSVLRNGDTSSLSLIKKGLDELISLAEEFSAHDTIIQTNLYNWESRLRFQLKQIREDLIRYVPWVELLPIPARFQNLIVIDRIPSLLSIRNMPDQLFEIIHAYEQEASTSDEKEWLSRMHQFLIVGSSLAIERITLLEDLAERCEQLSDVEYDFLYEKSTSLLRIGFNVDDQRKDDSFYDLLASEARLGIFVAIAQGKLSQESWFALGRLLTNSGGDPILLSWSGSMFEYLMPQLIMPSYENTLLHQTNKATVKRQIDYGKQRGVPWGISESGYNMVDANLNYQYRAFGVPGLGLKRGLEEDLVIAPYASMMALMISPVKACANLQALSKEGFEGQYGFYEAIDYTNSRLPRGKTSTIVKSYMVHHQGMGLLSLAYVLLDKPMQNRFLSEIRFQATLLLLQERIPRTTLFYAHTADLLQTHTTETNVPVRLITTPNTAMPELQLLSNGRYQVMITNSGGGYSRWKNIAVTRWREDATKDDRGIYCYIKDVETGEFWSNTHQPTLKPANSYETIFSLGHVEFRRQDYGIETKTEVVISPEDDTEMRRVKITNRTNAVRVLEVTSYAEIVMASQASDEAHPAFSNLFVQTEILPEQNAVLCTRRPRSEEEVPPWMFHRMDIRGADVEAISYETDRMQFIGRGKSLVNPQAMHTDALSGNQGSVLDPILSVRYRFSLKPNQIATTDLIYGITETRESCIALMHKYQDQHYKNRAVELSWTHSQVTLRQINATEGDAQLFGRLAGSVIYANPNLRADSALIQNNFRGQSWLWSHSISGDLPIILLHIYDRESMDLVKQMVQAHAYWRLKGLAVDLVIWNEDHGSYRQELQEQILGLITAEVNSGMIYNTPGNIYVKSVDQLSSEDRILFESVARVIIFDNKGTLSEQVNRHNIERVLPQLLETKSIIENKIEPPITLPNDLLFYNGTGGFTPDGKEYKLITDKKETTPAPWVNVIANPNFGTVISESGSAYTWAINAHEYRITPWSNDPVSDIGGEAFYLRDEETGHFWSPSPFPRSGISPYIITHGFGYTTFEHAELGISTEMSIYVDKVSPVKLIVLKIRNNSGRERKLSSTGFVEIILGDVRSKTNMHVVSEQDPNTGAMLLRNRYNSAFSERVAFFKVDGGVDFSFTADRSEFIGRNRSLENPQSMHRKRLSGRTGAGIDPCAALQVKFDLMDGAEKKIVFMLGNEENTHAADALIRKFTDPVVVSQSLQDVKEYWNEILTSVQISTPDKALNLLANGWLTYQTLACRMFARSGFYQSGGAFGFRDQLQDVLALLHTQPNLAREQILLSASRQFAEGDVQHWWHPPEGRGVRTRCSDDMLWLPFVVSRYVTATGDTDILTVPIGFLESRILLEGEETLYDLPISGLLSGTLYEHCVRAITYSLKYGQHGLPLIGAGDWNDGMDQVGHKGVGESVWLAFFLYDVMIRFQGVAKSYGDDPFAETCIKEASELQLNIEASGWDGEWYRRAYFDDGSPLGSKENEECRIDAIAQSWSVLSGAGNVGRRKQAMVSLDKFLVRRDLKLIQLLDPPFDKNGPNPGYIRGYVPGVRENGGQYSHAAIWALMAFAALGDRDKVYELFSMIQPLSHSSDPESSKIYKVEPYVMAADVYANESHRGRGGWTWYTGSAGWMYQFIMGSMLGMELQKDQLRFKPCFPLDWPSVSIQYQFGKSAYKITVFQVTENGGSYWKMDNIQGKGDTLQLIDDGIDHEGEVYIRI
ncbi:GH36-type glycosyl hydrolase domain-containing protein [Daejeonella sp.]|uniref:GH36-type glycosyl hydrolase domain-containing protein n=1 Tax=Daejeonella sp. TaxID=2805397 RepID=UPI00398374DD